MQSRAAFPYKAGIDLQHQYLEAKTDNTDADAPSPRMLNLTRTYPQMYFIAHGLDNPCRAFICSILAFKALVTSAALFQLSTP